MRHQRCPQPRIMRSFRKTPQSLGLQSLVYQCDWSHCTFREGSENTGVPEQRLSPAFCANSKRNEVLSRRDFLNAATALLVGMGLPRTGGTGGGKHGSAGSGQRVVLVIFGGVRRSRKFFTGGHRKYPLLVRRNVAPSAAVCRCPGRRRNGALQRDIQHLHGDLATRG